MFDASTEVTKLHEEAWLSTLIVFHQLHFS